MAATPVAAVARAHGARGPALSLVARAWRTCEGAERTTAWDALAQWASEPNPFFESWFLLPALRAFDPDGRVLLLTLEADGQLVGLMPVRRELRYYGHPLPHLRNWAHANCFLGAPLVARGFERMFWRRLLRWSDDTVGSALFLHLVHMPLAGPLHDALVAELADHPRPAATVLREERALLASDLASAAYLDAALSTKKRKELRRQHRRLAELGALSTQRLASGEELADWTADFIRLEASGWKGRGNSALASDRRTQALFTTALEGAARRGRLDRLALRLDGRPIAMLASFVAPPGAFSFKTAFDEDFARYSPGVLLQQENLAVLDDARVHWTDSCAAENHPMIDHLWRERRAIGRHSIGIGGPLRRRAFAALVRREIGHAPGGIV